MSSIEAIVVFENEVDKLLPVDQSQAIFALLEVSA